MQGQPLKTDFAALQENSEQFESASRRIGVAELDSALPIDVPFVARDPSDVPGTYLLVDHALYRAGKGADGALIVTGDHDDSIYSPPPE